MTIVKSNLNIYLHYNFYILKTNLHHCKVMAVLKLKVLLDPLLLIIYINDLDSGISSDISKFADDAKVVRPIHSDQDASVLQVELDQMYEWAGKWQMEFNVGKCSILSGRPRPP